MKKTLLALGIGLSAAAALFGAEQVVYDMEKCVALPGMSFWADGPQPVFRLLAPPECASGNSAMEVRFFPIKTYCNFGFTAPYPPEDCKALTFNYKDPVGTPPGIVELRELDGNWKQVRSFTARITWEPASEWTAKTIPVEQFPGLSEALRGPAAKGRRMIVLFNYTNKREGAGVKLDDAAWLTAGDKRLPICDFEKFRADTWVPDGMWLWADRESDNPTASLLSGGEAGGGLLSLAFRFGDCRYFQGISFHRPVEVPEGGAAFSFRYRVLEGGIAPDIRLIRPGEQGELVFSCRDFKPEEGNGWHTAVIPFDRFRQQKAPGNYRGNLSALKPGDKLRIDFCAGPGYAGSFALDDLKFTGN